MSGHDTPVAVDNFRNFNGNRTSRARSAGPRPDLPLGLAATCKIDAFGISYISYIGYIGYIECPANGSMIHFCGPARVEAVP
ncbi:hypothetical protein [Saccharopolyspora hattusasensis]|uniref:hypothetical protein n=1 Tax=Saccharopolyspora hattusasensis TaxID=1128679 RepID=UPI003D999123